MSPRPIIQALDKGTTLERHRHASAYAALVLDGSYLECGDSGRMQLHAGRIAVHDAYSAHLDVVGAAGASVINLLVASGMAPGLYDLPAIDDVLRLFAAGEQAGAAALLRDKAVPLPVTDMDWPDELRRDLSSNADLQFGYWAEARGLRPTELAAGFFGAFGTTPKRFRAETKTRNAVRRIAGSIDRLADIAIDAGFFDQAHMTRAVLAMTGFAPRALRTARPMASGAIG
ncbi:MAG: AraC family transcriptional regulator [Sphingomonas sp.]